MVPTAAMSGAQVRVGEIPWPKTGVTHCHTQIGLQGVGCLIGVT